MPMKTSTKTHDGEWHGNGGSQGIGQAIRSGLGGMRGQVIATDLTPPHGTVEKIGPAAHAFQLDVNRSRSRSTREAFLCLAVGE
jgi:3-oxoacyl-[acyl-carrier protein] reductase